MQWMGLLNRQGDELHPDNSDQDQSSQPESRKAGIPEFRKAGIQEGGDATPPAPLRCMGLGVAIEDGERPRETRSAGERRRLTDQEKRGGYEAMSERGAARFGVRAQAHQHPGDQGNAQTRETAKS